jgi:hypothetical protein
MLHGLVLASFLVAGQHGLQATRGGVQFIPVEVVEAGNGAQAAAAKGASVPSQQQAATESRPASAEAGNAPSPPQTPPEAAATDALDAKLQALAKLRQPEPGDSTGASLPATEEGAAFGLDDMYQVRDFIRAQVERRWHLDVATLGSKDVSVPIRVEITSDGRVIKADIVGSANNPDPVYDEIAVSARNAVLLASPFALPAGHYRDIMDMVISLDAKDALR